VQLHVCSCFTWRACSQVILVHLTYILLVKIATLWCDSQGNRELPYKFIEQQAKDTHAIVKFKLSCTIILLMDVSLGGLTSSLFLDNTLKDPSSFSFLLMRPAYFYTCDLLS